MFAPIYIGSSLEKHFKIFKAPGIWSFQFVQWIASHFFSRNVYTLKSAYRNFENVFRSQKRKIPKCPTSWKKKRREALAMEDYQPKNYVVIGSEISNVSWCIFRSSPHLPPLTFISPLLLVCFSF